MGGRRVVAEYLWLSDLLLLTELQLKQNIYLTCMTENFKQK